MATYTLIVKLDDAELVTLREGGYSLCIAKKVNGAFNVVWQGMSLLANIKIQWTEKYRVFGQKSFQDGALVNAGTNVVDIQYGQTSTLDVNGVMRPASGPLTGDSFRIANDLGSIHIGVEGLIDTTWSPVWVDPKHIITGLETFKPTVTILAWFDRNLKTSTMFSSTVSRSIEVDFTGKTSETISYISGKNPGSGTWSIGSSTSGLRYVPGRLYHPTSNTFEDLPFVKDSAIICGLIDKDLSSQVGASDSILNFIVQAVIRYDANVDLSQVAPFINANLPPGLRVSIEHTSPQTITAKIGWAASVQFKDSIQGANDIERLEAQFNSVINLYSHKYISLEYIVLKSASDETPDESNDLLEIPQARSSVFEDEHSAPSLVVYQPEQTEQTV